MATDKDRYAPLREATPQSPEAPSQAHEPTPTHDAAPDRAALDHVAAEHVERIADIEPAKDEPTQPTHLPWKSPGWTHEGGLVEQQDSARDWVKASHEYRQMSRQQLDETAPAPQQPVEQRSLSFFEDREPHNRDHGKLKVEQAQGTDRDSQETERQDQKRSLSFYEDRDQEQGHEHDGGHTR